MKKTLLFFFLIGMGIVYGQAFVDTLYQYHDTTVTYGTAVDFAGNSRSLAMDISYPTNDVPRPSTNGLRPVLLLIHGGAFMAGSKADPGIQAMRRDFAKRGYVTAAIDYRLGMFQTSSSWHCNISFFDAVEWDCLNQRDTLEWMRAYYRGIQDARGAIRYLVNNASTYDIDPGNVFVAGESAGSFIAMGVGYLDVAGEKPVGCGAIANATAPNAIYDQQCVQFYGLDTNIASMNLTRPDLGSIDGTMNFPAAQSYTIQGVGDMYGAVFENLFATNANDAAIPCLYMYHQPNDLIVPFNRNHVLIGYSYCCVTTFGCAYILNCPYVSGSSHIQTMIDALAVAGDSVPDYMADFSTNMADCGTQIVNPSVGGHQYDNYWLRTNNMAEFFAPCMDRIVGMADPRGAIAMQIIPNPSMGQFQVVLPDGVVAESIAVADLMGKIVLELNGNGNTTRVQMPEKLAQGTYIVRVQTSKGLIAQRVVLQ